jgi:hypothetical protein
MVNTELTPVPTTAIVGTLHKVIGNITATAVGEKTEAEDCIEAEKILSEISPVQKRSQWERLTFSLSKAGDVVEDQIMKVPGLFKPSKPKKGQKTSIRGGIQRENTER